MSYVAPSTRSTGNLITAAIWNQDIRDNRNYLHNCPSVQVYRTTNQTILNNTTTNVQFDAEIFDSQALHDSATATQINVVDTGVYFIHGMVKFASGAAGTRLMQFVITGAVPLAINSMRNSTTTAVEMSLSCVYYLDASLNPLRLQVLQVSGGSLDVVSDGTFVSRFGLCWIGN